MDVEGRKVRAILLFARPLEKTKQSKALEKFLHLLVMNSNASCTSYLRDAYR